MSHAALRWLEHEHPESAKATYLGSVRMSSVAALLLRPLTPCMGPTLWSDRHAAPVPRCVGVHGCKAPPSQRRALMCPRLSAAGQRQLMCVGSDSLGWLLTGITAMLRMLVST